MIRWLPGEPRDLALLPMAARRALDRAGWKMSLAQWEACPLPARERIAELGSQPIVDGDAVRAAAGVGAPIEAVAEPASDAVPEHVTALLPALGAREWSRLGVLARHALEMYARRGRVERVQEVYASLMSSGESQSSR